MSYVMNLNDGSEVTKLPYKPILGSCVVVKIDKIEKWYKITYVNKHQKWCTCRSLPDPNF